MILREEVLQLAELARLKLADGEIERLQKDISNILDYVGQVSAVAPRSSLSASVGVRNVLREDTPRPSTSSGQAADPMAGKEAQLKAAFPKQENSYNVVRKIIQKDE